jgi:predicted RNA binding protein YcfA (HicA-like mRNA interferase family)
MKLPVISGSDAVKAFRKAGYEFDRQRGSHFIIRRSDHNELAKGTLRALLREAGLTVEEFFEFL